MANYEQIKLCVHLLPFISELSAFYLVSTSVKIKIYIIVINYNITCSFVGAEIA
jgi:hypothetical protein